MPTSTPPHQAKPTSRTPTMIVAAAMSLIVLAIWMFGRARPAADTQPKSIVSATANAPATNDAANAAKASPSSSTPLMVSPSAATSASAAFARLTYGTGAGQLGRHRAVEGNPEAPMSLAVAGDGTTFVLDQVNGRVVRFGKDGKSLGETRITARAAQDLAIAPNGSVAVLDRLGDKRVDIVGPDGRSKGSFPLEGKGINEGGAVTGIFIDGDSVYAERAHAKLVRLGDLSGNADASREEVLGRPLRDGTAFAHAWMEGNPPTPLAFVAINERVGGNARFTRRIDSGALIYGISLLDSDRAGVIYLGLVVGSVGGTSGDGPSSILVVCLAPRDGATMGTATLPLSSLPDETFRELAVADGGGVTYLYRTEEGAELMRADCRGS